LLLLMIIPISLGVLYVWQESSAREGEDIH
jgi:hypothetical protein